MKKKSANQSDEALYTPPKPISLPPRRVVSIDPETKTITLEGPTPKEVIDLIEFERYRKQFVERFNGYYQSIGAEIAKHFGADSEHFAASKDRDHERLQRLARLLPDGTPTEAFLAMHAMLEISAMHAILANIKTIPKVWAILLCHAIDLGKLLQLHHDQMGFGHDVAMGKRNQRSRTAANDTKAREREQLKAAAHARYQVLIKVPNATKTSVLKKMAGGKCGVQAKHDQDLTKKRNADGILETVPKWPGITTLYEWAKDW